MDINNPTNSSINSVSNDLIPINPSNNTNIIGKPFRRRGVRLIKPEKIHKCNQCDKKYAQMSSLSRHKQKEHNPTFKNVIFCKYCGRDFYSGYELTVHTRSHTNERPYECKFRYDICFIF